MTQLEQEFIEAQKIPFSPYAQFHFACKGYDFLIDGKKISRSALFHNGFIDAEALISNTTKYRAFKRPKYSPFNFN